MAHGRIGAFVSSLAVACVFGGCPVPGPGADATASAEASDAEASDTGTGTSGGVVCPDELDNLCPEDLDCLGEPTYFLTDVQPKLVMSCSGPSCHASPNPAAGLDFQAGNAYELLAASSMFSSLPLVDPSNPYRSLIHHKLHGTHVCEEIVGTEAATKSVMPPEYEWDFPYMPGDPEYPKHVALLELRDTVDRWICCGALEQESGGN